MAAANKSATYDPIDVKASNKRAALVRTQWEDYKTRFHPWEDKLVNLANDSNIRNDAVNYANKSTENAFNVQRGVVDRNNSRLGLNSYSQGNTTQNRNMNLGKSLAKVNTNNQAIDYANSRENSIITNGLGTSAKNNRK